MPDPTVTPIDEWVLARMARISALADHYGLDRHAPDFAWDLAQALAEAHIEGFQINAGKGGKPPDPKQVALDIALFFEVWKARKEGRTDASAYKIVADRRQARGIKTTEAALRKRFGDLMKPCPAAVRMWRGVTMLAESPDEKSL
jgi:hypothetical protein